MIIVSHPTGNANVRAVLDGLQERNLLLRFHTSIASFPGNLWDKIGQLPPLHEFERRRFRPELSPYTRQHPWRELGRLAAGRAGLKSLTAHETGMFSVDHIYHALDRKVAEDVRASQEATAVYAYEDGALESFQAAKERGLTCVYDLPIAYWETLRELISEEAERRPDWAPTLGGGIRDSQQKLDRKTRELELADVVVGPGSFVMDSLPDWAADKRRIVSPFGSPVSPTEPAAAPPSRSGGKLRVLFVGSMGQRKGLGDLFEAMKLLNHPGIELVVLGSLQAPMEFYRREYPDFTYEATRPHAGVLELMASCDVFCLPSIVEGRALVMQEAMSRGLPVIITPNTGGADLVIPDETGILVPIRSPRAIAEAIQWFHDHREELPRMSAAARRHAAAYTWPAYGGTVARELSELLPSTVS
ncbi:glycosyltransferase involved in cell wall biosynthesis [Lewinella marina]|uniref:Group 1 glycosyl transferase n=1 Tax=Neolewinella marina TaxID=438751 RepID=A0A2G0CEA7_9BACT|nr:glycosyltransferase [Neolewinella marina]NJB87434.1 glycosyltransferase involved in cell wall biosynthesis [Neolewinella marina]PHK98257.1 group 1 glycosyl transferase [Neolewinella marina]